MGIIIVGPNLVENPHMEGVDTNDMEQLKAAMVNFEPRHFVVPFVAHAAGTFVGAALAAVLAGSAHQKLALAIGVWFLLGGIAVSFLLPAPAWFIALDLIAAYLPVGWVAGRLFGTEPQPEIA